MRILVTGASGFIGSHTVRALVDDGHAVRVLARTPARVDAALRPLGVDHVEVVEGDVVDRDAVARAVDGVDAVLHGAAIYTLDARKDAAMLRTNVEGTRHVLERAHAAGCDPIVYISSVVSLYPMRAPLVGALAEAPPLGDFPGGYPRSKREAEVVARELQSKGAPIVITHPGAVLGPNDPGPGEQRHLLRGFLGNRYPFRLPGAALLFCDVRWLARAHAALFATSERPRHVLMGGHYTPMSAWYELLRAVTGRRLPTPFFTPRALSLASGRMADLAQRLLPFVRVPLSYQQALSAYCPRPTDDAIAERLAGPQPPLEDSVRDAIAWLVAAGHLPASYAGKVLNEPRLEARA